MLRRVLLWASGNAWLRHRLPRMGFVRRAVRRFMPGEEVSDALAAAEGLNRAGFGALLTLLGEDVKDAAEVDGVVRHYEGVIEAIAARGLDAEVSLKLTHLGMDLDTGLAQNGLRRLATVAAARGQDVWVDMEQSGHVDHALAIFRCVRASHANVGLCLQSYLRRTPADLESLLPLRPMIRLVKGAYAEPPAVAFPDKADVDRAFAEIARRLLEMAAAHRGPREVLGTHDRALIGEILAWARGADVPSGLCEIHMLYGIQSEEQRRLRDAGHRVRVLISYGAAWFPWYMRRLAERPANLWFVVRNMLRG
jgi:proline dehydrogenase